jgi:hypothetical protein
LLWQLLLLLQSAFGSVLCFWTAVALKNVALQGRFECFKSNAKRQSEIPKESPQLSLGATLTKIPYAKTEVRDWRCTNCAAVSSCYFSIQISKFIDL